MATVATSSKTRPASAPPCVFIQTTKSSGSANAQRRLPAMNRGENPQLGGERERGEDLRTRGEAVGNFHDRQRAKAHATRRAPGLRLLASDCQRDAEGQQAHGHFQQQQARAAERAVRERERDFGDDFVVDPRLAVCGPRIRVGAH